MKIEVEPLWGNILKNHEIFSKGHWILPALTIDAVDDYKWHEGFSFTFIFEDLILDNSNKSFHRKVDFKKRLDGIVNKEEGLSTTFTPTMRLKQEAEGFKISISSNQNYFGVEDIEIATIPYGFIFPDAGNNQITIDELKRLGWTKDTGGYPDIEHQYFAVCRSYVVIHG